MSDIAYRESHREELRAKAQQYRTDNLGIVREKEKFRERQKWLTDPEFMRAKARLFYQNNKERLRAERVAMYEQLKTTTFDNLGGKCARCGFNDYRALQVDHVKRAQHPHNYFRRSGRGLYHLVRQSGYDKTLYQLLCANCNWIKRFELGEHNHYSRELALPVAV